MKLYFILLITFLLTNCSFDNKTGIWQNEQNQQKKEKEEDIFKDFKTISSFEDSFNKTIPINNSFSFNISKPIDNQNWKDIFFSKNNNFQNFKYNNSNQIIYKSKKLTKNAINKYKLFKDGNLIINDEKGNIIFFSVDKNKIISKFNFYKKEYKNIKKKLNFAVNGNVVLVADNLGYLYAYNYISDEVKWAKNYKVSFSSNIKILDNKILVSNQNNKLFIFDLTNGDLIKQFPTEEVLITNQFVNNLSINNKDQIFYLNTYGSLYSIDANLKKINWFINLNLSLESLQSNLFEANEMIVNGEEILISSNKNTFIINSNNGSIINKFNFSSHIRPIVHNNIAIFITKNNFLIAVDLTKKKIIYSYDLKQIIEIKKIINLKDIYKQIMILNGDVFIFLKNSNLLQFGFNGKFKNIKKLPSKIETFPILIESSILYLDRKNKLIILN